MQPGVSVIITSFNYGHFLGDAVRSALREVGPNDEVLIVDNCSTDDSYERALEFAKADRRVRVHQNEENLGLVGNHNRGLELARGERVLFLSADDMLLPGHFARIAAAEKIDPSVDIFYSPYVLVREDGSVAAEVFHPGWLRGEYRGERNDFAQLFAHDNYICFPTCLIDRQELLRIEGFEPALIAADLDIAMRFAREGKRFGFIAEPGVAIRLHEAEATAPSRYTRTGGALKERLHIFEKHLDAETMPRIRGYERRAFEVLRRLSGEIDPTQSTSLASVEQHFRALEMRLASSIESVQPPREKRLSIIALGSSLYHTVELVTHLRAHLTPEVELIVACSSVAASMVEYHLEGVDFKIIRYPGTVADTVAVNDALKLASGEVVTYTASGVTWAADHVRRIEETFQDKNINVAVCRADLHLTLEGQGRFAVSDYTSAQSAVASLGIGEPAPLPAFAHRNILVDQFGTMSEWLKLLGPLEFVTRLIANSRNLGAIDAKITITRAIEDIGALKTPAALFAELRHFHNACSANEATLQGRARQQQSLRAALNAVTVEGDLAQVPHVLLALRGVS